MQFTRSMHEKECPVLNVVPSYDALFQVNNLFHVNVLAEHISANDMEGKVKPHYPVLPAGIGVKLSYPSPAAPF